MPRCRPAHSLSEGQLLAFVSYPPPGRHPIRTRSCIMSDKTMEAKQAKQAAASWTAPTSVLYDRVLSPMYDEVARVLWPTWLHPNYITLLGGVFCTLSVLAMQRDAWGWACVLFTLYHACDNTDGKHARRTGKSSKFGHVLDHAVDA